MEPERQPAENPWGPLPVTCCLYCHAESTEPHLRWCRWDIWQHTGAKPADVRAVLA